MIRILSPEGVLEAEPDPTLTEGKLIQLMRDMVVSRVFDEWMLHIHPMGRVSRYAPAEGQEASMVGSAHALTELDWIFPTYREFPVLIARGVPLVELEHRMFANERDILKGHEITLYGDRNRRVVVGAGGVSLMAPVAVGLAMASQAKGEKSVSLVYMGDGATSKGDFHEAINFAGVFKPPVIFFCQNNQWAISVPVKLQTKAETLADKAKAYGMPGVRVDGNDVMAVYTVVRRFVEEARAGGGPAFIEAFTYRIGPHTTADDPKRYRSEEEVRYWRSLDPLDRMRRYLLKKGLWSEELEREVIESFRDELRRATEEAESTEAARPRVVLEDVYSTLQWHIAEEIRELEEYAAGLR
ncbi:MAG: thiamine pyrophosphate-dependent dehydrogenase E1 component subunit alpha [Nitrososphaerota archaeon]